jgi:Domain of unknown function (DUF5060)
VVTLFQPHEVTLEAKGRYANPYVELTAEASLTLPDGTVRTPPLFWDGGNQWRLRVAPHAPGTWKWSVNSRDVGLNGRSGTFFVRPGSRKGGLRRMREHTRNPDFDAIDAYRFSDQRVTRVGRLGFRVPRIFQHMAASRDGRWALVTNLVRSDSDLMRLDNFR